MPSTSTGSFWSQVRRAARRGWAGSFHARRTLPRIAEWSSPFSGEKRQETPLHLLVGRDHWQRAAWTVASWFESSEQAWPVVFHDDGTLPTDAAKQLAALFTTARVISRAEADAALANVLKPFPFCDEFRGMHPTALKLFDALHFASGQRLMIFDADLLFFNYPREIVEWAASGKDECWFNEALADAAAISADEASAELDVKLWAKVDTGLCLIHKPAIDFDFCDRALAQTALLRGALDRVEPTLFALCAGRHGKGGLLPRHYEVSAARHAAEQAISRRYAGAASDRFFGEGLRRLGGVLLARER